MIDAWVGFNVADVYDPMQCFLDLHFQKPILGAILGGRADPDFIVILGPSKLKRKRLTLTNARLRWGIGESRLWIGTPEPPVLVSTMARASHPMGVEPSCHAPGSKNGHIQSHPGV